MGSLISSDKAKQLAEAARERGTGSNAIPHGVHAMQISKVEALKTKASADAVVLTFKDTDGKYDPLMEWFVLGTEKGVGEGVLAQRLFTGAGVDIQSADNMEQLIGQVKRVLGDKTVQVAIQHEQKLWKKEDGTIVLTHKPRVWYIGPGDKELDFKVANAVVPLKPNEAADWDMYQKKVKGVSAGPSGPAVTDIEDVEETAPSKNMPAPDLQTNTQKAKATPAAKPAAKEEVAMPAPGGELDFLD